jgi:hypothetical protein
LHLSLTAKSSFDHPAFKINCSWLSALKAAKLGNWYLKKAFISGWGVEESFSVICVAGVEKAWPWFVLLYG